MERRVSSSVINRLPRYYRYISELNKNGIERISSKELSEKMRVTASQIRQDLNCFGGFGQQGYGYNVKSLHAEIGKILGLNTPHTAILVGAGNMGRAFSTNTTFETRGFKLIGIFDNDKKKIGTKVKNLEVQDYKNIHKFIEGNRPVMAILAVPRAVMNEVAHELMGLGIKAFLNFSYAELPPTDGISVENVHLSDSLMRLSYKISKNVNTETKNN